jgi:hypothetical protein
MKSVPKCASETIEETNKQIESMKLLLTRKPNLNYQNKVQSYVYYACTCTSLTKHTHLTQSGLTALMVAAVSVNLAGLLVLLEAKADINLQDKVRVFNLLAFTQKLYIS